MAKKTKPSVKAGGKKKVEVFDGIEVTSVSKFTVGKPMSVTSFVSLKVTTEPYENATFGQTIVQAVPDSSSPEDILRAMDEGIAICFLGLQDAVIETRKRYGNQH